MRWEYKTVLWHDVPMVPGALNAAGKEGWELIGFVVTPDTDFVYVFKRPLVAADLPTA